MTMQDTECINTLLLFGAFLYNSVMQEFIYNNKNN